MALSSPSRPSLCLNLHRARGFVLAALASILVACGGADPNLAEHKHTLAEGEEFVDDDGLHELTPAEIASAAIQDSLADRLRAQREAANFSAKINLAPYVIDYESQPTLTRSSYFDIQVKSDSYPWVAAQILQEAQNYPKYGARFDFTDISLTAVNGQVQLHNNTPRTFRQMLVRQANGSMLALDFGTKTILPFSTSTVRATGLQGGESFYDTASLFRPVGYRFDTSKLAADACDQGSRCMRQATADEQRRLERTLARIKAIYNTHGLIGYASLFSAGTSCKNGGYTAACNSLGGDTELYMWTQVGMMALYPRGGANLCIISGFGATGVATVGGSSGSLCTSSSAASVLRTVHHETAHNYGYGHSSGMTYGFSDLLQDRVTADQDIHLLPARALVATPTTESNTWVLSVLSRQAESPRSMRFMFLAREKDFAARLGTIPGNPNQFVLKLEKKPAYAFSVSVYRQAPDGRGSQQGESLGSVVLHGL